MMLLEPPRTEAEARTQLAQMAALPAVERLLQEERAAVEQRRSKAVEELAEIDLNKARDLLAADAAIQQADADYQSALKTLQAAEQQRRAAVVARTRIDIAADAARRKPERFLRESADPRINALASDISRALGTHPRRDTP